MPSFYVQQWTAKGYCYDMMITHHSITLTRNITKILINIKVVIISLETGLILMTEK